MRTKTVGADYMSCAFDPAYFMKWAFGIKPDPWQADFLRDKSSKRVIFLCSRQAGKSTVCASDVLHEAIFIPNSVILIVAPRMRQAQETFKKVKVGYRKAQKFCGFKKKNTIELELTNNSRIISLPGEGDNIRSYSGVSSIVIDEASRVPDDVYRAVKPMLSTSGGRLIALSTPFGQRGWFYERVMEPEFWKHVKITADECPRITLEFIEEEKREHGISWVEQEYYCKFTASESQVFSHEIIMNAIRPGFPVLEIPRIAA